MREINNKLVAIYYAIYAVFIIGLVIAHIYPLWFGWLSSSTSLVLGYVEVFALLLFVPGSLILCGHKLKKQVDLDYYFKWNAIQMLLMVVPGLISVVCYASLCKFGTSGELVRDRSSLFAYLIVFVALILTKPTKLKIQNYFKEKEE